MRFFSISLPPFFVETIKPLHSSYLRAVTTELHEDIDYVLEVMVHHYFFLKSSTSLYACPTLNIFKRLELQFSVAPASGIL